MKLLKSISSAWYEFLYQYTGKIEYAKVPRFRPPPETRHDAGQLGLRNPANYRYERISIHCTNPDFQRFLMGHAKECLELIAKDPSFFSPEIPTYRDTLKRKCGEAVLWTLRMMPYTPGPKPDVEKLKQDVIDRILLPEP